MHINYFVALALGLLLVSGPAAADRAVSYTYNALGQVTSIDGPRTDVSDITTYSYDAQGNRTTVTNALGHTTNITAYDAAGRPLSFTDPNGLTTGLAYDLRGRLISRNVGGELTTFSYDGVGNLTAVRLPDGSRISYIYDAARRLTAIQDAQGNRIAYTLDAMGNRTAEQVFDAGGSLVRTHTYVYDQLSRLIQSLGANGQTTTVSYDPNGNPLATTDAHSQTIAQGFDALNRLVQVNDPLGGVVAYGYNAQDHLVSVTDALGHTTTYNYDGLGNLLSQQSPDTGTTTYTHDAAGNALSQTDPKGQTTNYAYDALNRLTQVTYHDGQQVSYGYDNCTYGIGRLCSLSDSHSTTAWEYDSHGRVSAKHQTLGSLTLTTRYHYNAAGQLIQMTYPSGLAVGYEYSQGQLSALSINGQPHIAGITYQPFGPVSGWAWSSGRMHSRAYDLDGQLTQQTLGEGSRALNYDALGNISAILDPQTSLTLSYDALSRLTAANDTDYSQSWSYDLNGNRLSQSADSTLTTYVIDPASNRLAQVDTTPYQYDSNGNLIADGRHSYSFDAKNRLTAVDDGNTARYTHNALGQRIHKTALQQGAGPDYLALAEQAEAEARAHRDQAAQLRQQANDTKAEARQLNRLVREARREASRTEREAARLTTRATRESERAQEIQQHADELAQSAQDYRAQIVPNPTSVMQRIENRLYQRLADFYQRWSDKRAAQATERQQNAEALSQQAQAKTEEAALLLQQADRLTAQAEAKQQEAQQLQAEANEHLQQARQLEHQAAEYRQLAEQGGGNITTAQTTVFMYDEQGQLVGEYDEAGTVKQETIWLGNLPVATHQNGQTYAVHTDHLGTPRVITDSSYVEVWRWDSDPFGTTAANEDPGGGGSTFAYNLRFPGQYYDAETGLHYNYFRDYAPSTGRYIESDLIGLLGGMNLYAYVNSNPILGVDPMGLFWDGSTPPTTPVPNPNPTPNQPRFPTSSCGPAGSPSNYPNGMFGQWGFEFACKYHDQCYGTCGADKGYCDNAFKEIMRWECNKLGDMVSRQMCRNMAQTYYQAVNHGGDDAYNNAQRGCSCKP